MCPSRRLARINIKWLTPFSPQSIRSVLSYAAGVRLSGKRFSWPTISRSLIGVLLRRRALVANQSHLPQGRLIERVGNGRKSATSPRRFKTFRGKFQVWSVHMCKTVLQSEGAGGSFRAYMGSVIGWCDRGATRHCAARVEPRLLLGRNASIRQPKAVLHQCADRRLLPCDCESSFIGLRRCRRSARQALLVVSPPSEPIAVSFGQD